MASDVTVARQAAITETIDFAFYPRIPEISLELTNLCNLTCPYCANPALTRPKGTIEWELLEKIVDESAHGRLSINWLHGVGEPLLWKRLEDVIRLVRGRDAGAASFATNGTLLFEDRARALLDAGLTRIYISIDTLDPEVYKATRGGNLRKVVDNIQALIRVAPSDFMIRIALMDHRDYRLTQIERQRFQETFGDRPNVILADVTNALMPSAPSDYRVETGGRVNGCFAPLSYLFVNKDGIASLCCADQDSLHPLGDIHDRSIHDIWYDPRNQTTFRNIAIGAHACPSVCTERCILNQPKTGPNLGTMVGYTLPFETGRALLIDLMDRNDIAAAAELAIALNSRDPLDPTIGRMMVDLRSLSAPAAPAPHTPGASIL
ncbi:MAG: radical SAM protein [Proteobacteria bacterium]|nr:radical SAM protein [Pseudomonadota bacterium]